MGDAALIRTRDLRKEFQLGGQTIAAVDGIDLDVDAGEILSIVGPSGSGKSTLLGLIGGLDTPTSGSILLDGVEIGGMGERELTDIRNDKLGFVFQFFNLIPSLSARENVALPIQFANQRRFDPDDRSVALLERLGLEDRLDHRPNQLSGGEQQRVAIARALANNPPILMTDEPTGNLNSEAGRLVIETLKQVRDDFGTTVLLVTHDNSLAGEADRTVTLVDGRLLV